GRTVHADNDPSLVGRFSCHGVLLRLRIDLSHRLRSGRGPNRPKGPEEPGEGSLLPYAPPCERRRTAGVELSGGSIGPKIEAAVTSLRGPTSRPSASGEQGRDQGVRDLTPGVGEEGHESTGAISLLAPFQQCHRGPMTLIDTETLAACADSRRGDADFGVRPIEPTDAGALVRFHARLSRRSIQLRYFYPHREFQPAELTHLTCVDGFNRVAYVVEHDGEIIAVGRYDRL